jgi:signal transduction histidine kinase
MQQVVQNLLQNAIKYADDDPKKFEVEINYAKEGEFAPISVRDHGIGVPLAIENRIFPFGYRAMNAIAKQPTGLGFGLAIAQKIVQAHGGQLEFRRPRNGGGSEFVILIPRAE